jgi:DNA-directed RNA polymerase I, II, and III subunit RPABC1
MEESFSVMENNIDMEVLKTMLSQRGVDAATVEDLQTDLPGTSYKIGEYFVYFSSKLRISEKDIVSSILPQTESAGATRSIVVVDVPPSAAVLNVVRKYSDKLQLFHSKQLIFDITTHRKVPPHRILTNEEKTAFLEKIRANPSHLPAIDSQDPMAKWIGARPGDIVEILRMSETAGSTPYWRVCVANTSL